MQSQTQYGNTKERIRTRNMEVIIQDSILACYTTTTIAITMHMRAFPAGYNVTQAGIVLNHHNLDFTSTVVQPTSIICCSGS